MEVHLTSEAEVNKPSQVIDAVTIANGIAPDEVLANKGYAIQERRYQTPNGK